jgi:hypothetical protein
MLLTATSFTLLVIATFHFIREHHEEAEVLSSTPQFVNDEIVFRRHSYSMQYAKITYAYECCFAPMSNTR